MLELASLHSNRNALTVREAILVSQVILIEPNMVVVSYVQVAGVAHGASLTRAINNIKNGTKVTTTARPPQQLIQRRVPSRRRSDDGGSSFSPVCVMASYGVVESWSPSTREEVFPLIDIHGNGFPLAPLPKQNYALTEEVITMISKRNDEPEWMLQFRLNALNQWLMMKEPEELLQTSRRIDFRTVCDFASRVYQRDDNSSANSQRVLSSDAGTSDNSDSFATTHQKALAEAGVIFCSISEAIQKYPELVRKYLGKVVSSSENYFAALNSAIFTDGSFCYVPKNTICPIDISTYFLVEGRKVTNLFERNLIICEEGSYVSSLGCTSPSPSMDASQQLNVPVIELYCAEGAEIKYFVVENWQEPGANRSPVQSEVYNFVTQRGLCDGPRSKITWITVELGSTIAWHHPTVVLKGNGSTGQSFSMTMLNSGQFADMGARIIHMGSNTKSRVVSKSVHAGNSHGCFRSYVEIHPLAKNARSEVTWDAMLLGPHAEAVSYPSSTVLLAPLNLLCAN